MSPISTLPKLNKSFKLTAAGLEHRCGGQCHRWKQADTLTFAADKTAANGLGSECRECARERTSIWRGNNIQKTRDHSANRYALVKKASGTFPPEHFLLLKRIYHFQCLRCHTLDRPGCRLVADHTIPLSKNGSHDITNRQPLCPTCNRIKADKCTDYRILFHAGYLVPAVAA